MTVESIGIYGGIKKANCVWFDEFKKDEDLFALETLEKANK